MNKSRVLAVFVMIGSAGACVSVQGTSGPGATVLSDAFDPRKSFAGDLVPNSDDELVLAVWASAREDYAPDYSLAIAYRCVAFETAGERRCGYTARMLRTAATDDERFEKSLDIAAQSRSVSSAEDMRERLDSASIQWLETEVDACPNGVFAMDSVRVADWRPDMHYALKPVEERQIIMHPAAIRVTMHGTYTTSTYEGWVLAAGVPAAVSHLLQTLEPCWRPALSPRPWRRVEGR